MMSMMLKSQLQSEEMIKQVSERLDQLSGHNKMLENQIANQASTSSTRVTGKLPARPKNLREHVNEIVTRSGKILGEPSLPIDTSIASKIVDVEIEEKLEEGEVRPAALKPNQQVPSYGNFLRDILAKKRKFGEHEIVAMTQEYQALSHDEGRNLRKHRDPGKFTIPCVIRGCTIKRSFYDLGAIVNIMPLSLCQKLKLRDSQPVQLTLQFADQFTRSPIGIFEDVPVRVDKYFVPCDFIVIDVQENSDVPIILGRPFLATTGTITDARKGSMIFYFGEEKVEFDVHGEPKSHNVENCSMVNSKPFVHLDPSFEIAHKKHVNWNNFFGVEVNLADQPG
ncbi:PREDICTED: uncharacterized protein LOC109171677 [Ipomoea nil]|uniref:uncharacterized protein LOC109171677 n=1 Tax=Ipomoea nil TaxID=35883 RepID=UPI000900CFFA|nr:PREDICTED: uncharacterized protein LOC109171677 [Ipomoea nil]